jgi:hypothetical protein
MASQHCRIRCCRWWKRGVNRLMPHPRVNRLMLHPVQALTNKIQFLTWRSKRKHCICCGCDLLNDTIRPAFPTQENTENCTLNGICIWGNLS